MVWRVGSKVLGDNGDIPCNWWKIEAFVEWVVLLAVGVYHTLCRKSSGSSIP